MALTSETADRATASDAAGRTAAIELTGLIRRYGDRDALAGVDLRVEPGETLVLFGPNGAGKTTLLRVLATLLLPHDGEARVFGHKLPDEAHLARSKVGMLGHEPMLYRDLTGRQNLEFYARLYALDNPEGRIAELLETTAMDTRADDPVRELSRGMLQRLAVCRAVLHAPELLLLDEPQSGLDPQAEQLVEPLIGHVSGNTRVIVTHDIERGLVEADRVVGLRDGYVMFDQPKLQTTPEQVRELYKGSHP